MPQNRIEPTPDGVRNASASPAVAGLDIRADPKRESILRRIASDSSVKLAFGMVVHCQPQSLSYIVNIDGSPLRCIKGGDSTGAGGSATRYTAILSGTPVLVAMPKNGDIGVIISVLGQTTQGMDIFPSLPRQELETGSCSDDEAITCPVNDPTLKLPKSNSQTPLDVLPGDNISFDPTYGTMCGIKGPEAVLEASPLASVRTSAIDDSVDIVGQNLLVQTGTKDTHDFNDGGFLSSVESVSIYEHERHGELKTGTPVFEKTSSVMCVLKGFIAKWKKKKSNAKPIPRLQIFKGYLGGVLHAFVSTPETGTEKPAGLMSFHVAEDGSILLDTASGLTVCKRSAIPVPIKNKEPWDPEGDRASKLPYKATKSSSWHGTPDDPSLAGLCCKDASAWRRFIGYLPFVTKFTKDYTVDTEPKTPSPKDNYDTTAETSAEFSKQKMSEVQLRINPDGSVVLQAGGGCEMIFADGTIRLHAPKGLFFSSGEDVAVLAGRTVAVKGKQNVELSATDGSAILKGEKSAEVVANGEESELSLLSNGASRLDATRMSINTNSFGVIAKDSVALTTPGSTSIMSDTVQVISDRTLMVGKSGTSIMSKPGTSLTVTENSVQLSSSVLQLLSSSGVLLTNGRQAAAIEWSPSFKTDLAEDAMDTVRKQVEPLIATVDSLYATVQNSKREWSVSWAGSEKTLTLVVPEWSLFPSAYKLSSKVWEEKPVGGADLGEDSKTYPWPYIVAYKGNTLLTIDKPLNVDTKTLHALAWEALSETPAQPSKINMHRYPIKG